MTDFALLFLLVCLAVGAGIAWFRILAAVVDNARTQREIDKWWSERQTSLDESLDSARRRLHDLRSESSSLEDDSPRDAANHNVSR